MLASSDTHTHAQTQREREREASSAKHPRNHTKVIWPFLLREANYILVLEGTQFVPLDYVWRLNDHGIWVNVQSASFWGIYVDVTYTLHHRMVGSIAPTTLTVHFPTLSFLTPKGKLLWNKTKVKLLPHALINVVDCFQSYWYYMCTHFTDDSGRKIHNAVYWKKSTVARIYNNL